MTLKRLFPILVLVPVLAAVFAAVPVALLAAPAVAQTPAVTSIGASVPITHVLAIGIVSMADVKSADLKTVMPAEVKATVGLYLSGKIDQWWVRKDGQGVVFLLNAANVEDARALLAPLPLVASGRLKFDLMPLGPLRPLQYLTDGVDE